MLLSSNQCKVPLTMSRKYFDILYILFILLYLYLAISIHSDTAPQVQLLKSGIPVKSDVVFLSNFSFVFFNL